MIELRKNLALILQREGLTPAAFAKKSGVSREIISLLLNDKLKNTGILNIIKIADAANVSIDELVGRKNIPLRKTNFLKYYKNIFLQAYEYVTNFITQHNLKNCNVNDVLHAITEIYDYSVNKNENVIDKEFARWFCEKQILLQQPQSSES